MSTAARIQQHAFMYEPDMPPTIPPGMTIDAFRRACGVRKRRGRARRAFVSCVRVILEGALFSASG